MDGRRSKWWTRGPFQSAPKGHKNPILGQYRLTESGSNAMLWEMNSFDKLNDVELARPNTWPADVIHFWTIINRLQRPYSLACDQKWAEQKYSGKDLHSNGHISRTMATIIRIYSSNSMSISAPSKGLFFSIITHYCIFKQASSFI